MKQFLLSFSILIGTLLQAQQIPNGSFENWVQEPYGEEPNNWGEYSLQLMHDILPNIVDSTIVKSEDAYSGSFAMELRSKALTGFLSDTIVPVVMLNLKNSDTDSARMKIDSTLESLSGYIKQDLVNSAENGTAISITVYSEGDIIGIGAQEFDENIDEYTSFNIPILYMEEGQGDFIEIMIIAGNSDNPLPGNILKLDDFKLNYQSTPTNRKEIISSKIGVYPNPFVDQLTINSESTEAQEYELYSLHGKMVLKGFMSKKVNTINLSNLPPNIYFLKTDNQSIKLIKQK